MIRFNIPWTYSTILGTRIENPFLLCSIEDNVITMSHLGHSENQFRVPVYYCNNKTRSLNSPHNCDEDYQYFLLSKALCPFEANQEVTFRYLGDDGLSERRFTISIEDDVRPMYYVDLLPYHRNRYDTSTRKRLDKTFKEVYYQDTLKWWQKSTKRFIYKDNAFFDKEHYVVYKDAPEGTETIVKELQQQYFK